jgi:putative FmdB family regulatory protein
MPLWDTRCTVCGREAEDRIVWRDQLPACEDCGGATEKRYTHMPAIHQDTIPGGLTIEHLAANPIRVESRSEYRRLLKEHGVVNKVQHIGQNHTDKSKLTSRWI